MRLAKKLSSIFTKKEDSEIFYLTSTVERELEGVISQLSEMQIQTILSSSTGDWLDLWGNKFGIFRSKDELDDPYRKRIMDSVTSLKGTIPALIAAVKRALGDDTNVLVHETYKDLRIFNVSTYSGTGKYQDSDTVRLGVVVLYIDKYPNDKLREEMWKSKAMGTKIIIETRIEMIDPDEELSEFYMVPQDRIMIDDTEGVSGLISSLLDIEIQNA